MQIYRGLAVSEGVAIGKVLKIHSAFVNYPRVNLHHKEEIQPEVERLLVAKQATIDQIDGLVNTTGGELEDEFKELFQGYRLLLEDRQLVPAIIKHIEQQQINAEWALINILVELEDRFKAIPDPYIRARFDDIRQLGEKLMGNLLQKSALDLSTLKEPVIIVSQDISPADAFHLAKDNILGIITELGGETSHSTILARAMNIPAVVGVTDATLRLTENQEIILDGSSGEVIDAPTAEQITEKLSKQEQFAFYERELEKYIGVDCQLQDETFVDLAANLDFEEELPSIKRLLVSSIGLMRTEFLFTLEERFPTEEEQYQLFLKVIEETECNPVTIRTWDIGADKSTHLFSELHSESNPALGLRAVRICLKHTDVFRTQIRAILRASQHCQIKLMIPMITRIDEVVKTQELIQQEQLNLGIGSENLKIGAMVETPASVFILDEILDLCDFISIGSNDLIQYSLAVDRLNEHVAHLFSPFHPSILKMLEMIVVTANNREKPVSICGELAANPVMQMFLIGVGEITFSMSPNRILKTKRILSRVDRPNCQKIAFQFINKHSFEESAAFADELKQRYLQEAWD